MYDVTNFTLFFLKSSLICIYVPERLEMAAVKSQSSLTQQAGMQAVDLTKLNLMQLTQFKQGLDTDLQFYQESLQNLKLAQSK